MPSTSVATADHKHIRRQRGSPEFHTFLFEIHSTFGDDYRDISVYIALALLIGEGNGHVCVFNAVFQRHAKDANRSFHHMN
jgi:hypothetical protein